MLTCAVHSSEHVYKHVYMGRTGPAPCLQTPTSELRRLAPYSSHAPYKKAPNRIGGLAVHAFVRDTEGVSSWLRRVQTTCCAVQCQGAVMCTRLLELVFFLYFASHIPITILIDLQALFPDHVYPDVVSGACCENP